jgi:xylono-1,5-lactonase
MNAGSPVAVAPAAAELGEGPVWDARRACLWFVDIKKHQLLRFDPDSRALQRWSAPGQLGWVVPARDGTLIAGLQGALHRFDPDTGAFTFLREVEGDRPGNRLNDGTTDSSGAIWFGTMDDAEEAATGRIYRLADGMLADSGLPPVSITNGPAFCADGGTMYHTDTLGRCIHVSRMQDGLPCETRVFARIEGGYGYPDGPVVDSEGCLWTGLFGGWGARRYAQDGRLIATVRFPVANVTKLAFGGPDLRTVYATTARKGLTPAQIAEQPLAGDLFAFDVDVAGLPTTPAIGLP